MLLVIGILPSITACKSSAGRTRIAQASKPSNLDGNHHQASAFAKALHDINVKHGLPVELNAEFEAVKAVAFIRITSLAVF